MTPISKIVSNFRLGYKREWIALLATFFSVFNKGISLVAIFLYVRWTIPYLGNERFGVWMTLSTIITFITIFSDFGLSGSLVNQVAYAKAKNSYTELKKLTSSAFFFLCIVAVSIAICCYFFSSQIVSVLGNGLSSEQEISEVKNGLLCLLLIFLINLPLVTVDKTLEGLQLAYVSSIWTATGNILSLGATYFVTQHSLGIVWLILSTMGVQAAFRVVYFLIEFNGRLKEGRPSFREMDTRRISTLLKYGLMFFLLNIFNVVSFQVDNIIISKELGVNKVAQFSLMQKLATISFFFLFYTASLWPAFAEAHAKGDKEWMRKTVSFLIKLNFFFSLAFGLIIIFLSPAIMSFWSKDVIARPSFVMSLGFALFILTNGMIAAVSIFFNSGPMLRKHVIEFCVAGICTVLLKFLFVKQLGPDYLMYMSVLPFLFIYLIPCYVKYRKFIRQNG